MPSRDTFECIPAPYSVALYASQRQSRRQRVCGLAHNELEAPGTFLSQACPARDSTRCSKNKKQARLDATRNFALPCMPKRHDKRGSGCDRSTRVGFFKRSRRAQTNARTMSTTARLLWHSRDSLLVIVGTHHAEPTIIISAYQVLPGRFPHATGRLLATQRTAVDVGDLRLEWLQLQQ